jgi:hypothetical protein
MSFPYVELKRLTNHQRRRLRDEVLPKTFDRNGLNRFLSEEIGEITLEQISTDSNLITQFDEVLGWFSDNDRAGEFCDAVQRKFPQQQSLLEQIRRRCFSTRSAVFRSIVRCRPSSSLFPDCPRTKLI